MKKTVPEIRMTEAARKRSAKIRQDKETAENKPVSPRPSSRIRAPLPQLGRPKTLVEKNTKPLIDKKQIPTVTRSGTVAVTITAPSKKPKIEKVENRSENRNMTIRSTRPNRSTKTVEVTQNSAGIGSSRPSSRRQLIEKNEKPIVKKMSSITQAKVREREEKEAWQNSN